jgi:histidinol-phosphate aminotransferase
MSRFFSERHAALEAYTPGEQPQDQQYIKLNTNESPFPPSPGVVEAARAAAETLQLYSDPESKELTQAVAALYGLTPEQVLMTNGSDEILNFAFMAFCDEQHPVAFPDISYGFYSVFAQLHHIPYTEIPLDPTFHVNYRDYCGIGKNIVIANPNAPTGLILPVGEIEEIVRTNPDNLVVIDEAYIDFGGESCLPLLEKYDNLLITRTFSKSYSLAGGRLGFGVGAPEVIQDLNTIKYSTNPYNVNRMTAAAGLAAVRENGYYMDNCQVIQSNRTYTKARLEEMGFRVLDSRTNFLFASHPELDGTTLYRELRARGILVRHFNKPRISGFVRITIGTRQQMDALLQAAAELLGEKGENPCV